MSNSLLSSAVIAVIVVIVSGYVVSYSVDIDTVADVVFTAMLNVAHAGHFELNLNATDVDNLDDEDLKLDGVNGITTFKSGANTYAAVTTRTDDGVQIIDITDPTNIIATDSIADSLTLELKDAFGIATFKSGANTYAAVAAVGDSGVQILDVTDPTNITPTGNITDGGTLELKGANGITTFKSGTGTYAAVAAYDDNGVQILNVTDPTNITATDSIDDSDDAALELEGARAITTFKSGTDTYVAVAARGDDGVQILNVTDPTDIAATASITDGGTLKLKGANGIATFKSGTGTYVAVAALTDKGVQILNVTDPTDITATGNIEDGGTLKLLGASGITTFKLTNHTYAAVASQTDDAVQIIDVTDPTDIRATVSITNGDTLELDGAEGITTFKSGTDTYVAVVAFGDDGVQILDVTDSAGIAATDSIDNLDLKLKGVETITTFKSGANTYAAVTTRTDDGVQIIDITDPANIIATGSIADSLTLELKDAFGIATFKSGANTYAAVAAVGDSGVQILDVTDPTNITPTGNITDGGTLELKGANGIATFKSGTGTYAAVAAYDDNGVQILNVTDPTNITATDSIDDSDDAALELEGARAITTFKSGTDTYVAVAARGDDGVQILNVTDPTDIAATASITDGGTLKLKGANGIATFKSGTGTYVAVAALTDNGVQILNVTDPTDITATGNIEDGGTLELLGASGITTFKLTNHTYAAVASQTDDAVQIIDVTDPTDIRAAGSITDNLTLELDGANGITTFKSGTDTYVAVVAFGDDGVQIIRIGTGESDTPSPTFNSSELDGTTGVLTITFSRTIDVTPATNVVPTKIHIRESGNYTGGGITLSAGELDTAADGATISFNLTASHLATVAGLTTPELTIQPGAVRDTSGNTIEGTFDISTATFVAPPFDVLSQEDSPTGMAFSNDGAKMFVVGSDGDEINEYALSTAFDLSTATFVAPPFNITSQETFPTGMAFSNDGDKMFVVGSDGDEINEYALSTAFDLSTATFVAPPFNITSQEASPTGMAFSNDGAKMFVVGFSGGDINEYALSTAFDISTATFVAPPFSITSQEASPTGMAFSNDGAKMFVVGGAGDDINEYTLSTAFDLSTAAFVASSFNVTSQDKSPTDMTFSNDGAKMFVVGSNGGDINEYALSSVYPITVTAAINNPPVAEAGPDLPVVEGGSITLQGSGSDDDNDPLTYSWSQDFRLSFDNSSSATPEVTASSVTADTQIILTLTVSDGTTFVEDMMTLTIRNVNNAPLAEAGPDLPVVEGGSITLQGSGSDDDNDPLTYSWSQDFRLSFDNSSSATPEVTASSVTADTQIILTLTVSDGTTFVEDMMTLTIRNVNNAPLAEAGPDLPVVEGGSITLQGSGSDDDNDPLTYSWSQDFRLSFDNSSSATPEVTASSVTADTQIILTLTVSDGTTFVEDMMTLTIRNVNNAPLAEAGPDLPVVEGGSITLQGSGSDDDNDPLTYSWSQDFRLSFDNSSSATPEVTASSVTADTQIILTLTVSDGTTFVEDMMTLTIRNVNNAPLAEAGPDLPVVEGGSITLQGSGSDDDNDPLTYSWSQSPATPVISFGNQTSATSTVTAPSVAADTTITLTLTVNDGTTTDTDMMVLTVQDVTSQNFRPTVNAGPDQTVNEGAAVTLSGTASDPDDDQLEYAWTQVSGPTVMLASDDTLRPQFTAPRLTSDGEIVLMLTVTDGAGGSAEDTVTVTVRDVPISVSSATYSPGSGQLIIAFNQDIGPSDPDYSAMHIRSTGSDSGGIALSGVTAIHTGRTITATLDSEQQEEYGDLDSPQLDIEDGAVDDADGVLIAQMLNIPISDASRKNTSSSKAPVVHINALAQARIVDIPPRIAEQVASHDDSDPLEPLTPDGTFDFPLVINGYGYLLDDVTNTLVPQTVTAGDDSTVHVTFTVYTQKDLAHFTLYLNLQGENINYANSDTYITYKNDDGTTGVTDPHGYIGSATITVTQKDGDLIPEKKTVRIIVEFAEPMGPANMVAYTWNTDRKAVFVKIIDAFEVVAALLEPVVQAADPEPLEPDSVLPADPEPVSPDFADDAADPEPVPTDALWPADDYDEAQVLTLVRTWSGFESEMITDTQLLELLGLEGYQDADLPDWMMTELGVLVARGDVTVDEFMLALQYVLERA